MSFLYTRFHPSVWRMTSGIPPAVLPPSGRTQRCSALKRTAIMDANDKTEVSHDPLRPYMFLKTHRPCLFRPLLLPPYTFSCRWLCQFRKPWLQHFRLRILTVVKSVIYNEASYTVKPQYNEVPRDLENVFDGATLYYTRVKPIYIGSVTSYIISKEHRFTLKSKFLDNTRLLKLYQKVFFNMIH